MSDRHWFGVQSASSKGSGHPVMFGMPQRATHFELFADGGGYPKGFVEWALRVMREHSGRQVDATRVLHLCSGSMVTGVRVDIRPERNPDVVADCRATPFENESFDWIMADPPYSEEYARNLYGTADVYPKPGQIMSEASRLLRPGGFVGLLHFQVPVIRKPLEIVGVFGVTTGCGYAIRAWTLCQKREA